MEIIWMFEHTEIEAKDQVPNLTFDFRKKLTKGALCSTEMSMNVKLPL